MFKFFNLLLSPLIFLVIVGFSLIVSEETKLETKNEVSIYEYCSTEYGYGERMTSSQLLRCTREVSDRYNSYVYAVIRSPNINFINDKGSCDFAALESFLFRNAHEDIVKRLTYLRSCQDRASMSIDLRIAGTKRQQDYIEGKIFNGKPVNIVGKGPVRDLAAFANYTCTESYTHYYRNQIERGIRDAEEACNYFVSETSKRYAKTYPNSTIEDILKDKEYDTKVFYSFSIWLTILIFLPIFIYIYLLVKFRKKLFPSSFEDATGWMNSQRKFRISIVLILLWTLTWSLAEFIGGADEPILLFSIAAYPLIVLLMLKFIASSDD